MREIPECKTIYLYDASSIYRCGWSINLARLEILKTGESWYNQRGYKQRAYEKETEENIKTITMSHENAASLLLENPVVSETRFLEFKSKLDAKFPELKGLQLNEYIQKLYQLIKSYPEENKCSVSQNQDTDTHMLHHPALWFCILVFHGPIHPLFATTMFRCVNHVQVRICLIGEWSNWTSHHQT